MLRRATLLLLLAAPLGALAQSLTFDPNELGKSDCASSSGNVNLSWTVTLLSGQTLVASSDVYRVQISSASGCPASSTTVTTTTLPNQLATSLTQTWTMTRSTFLADAGVTSCSAAQTLYACVTLLDSTAATVKSTVATSSIGLTLTPPPVPVSVSVSPGDGALYVSWAAGSSATSTVAADHYDVTMTVAAASDDTGTDPTATHAAQSFSGTSGRYTGLVNGVTYQASVVAVSAGGNASAASDTAPAATRGRPMAVSDYWSSYKAAGGLDPGGCGGGPAGALSLLGVAALARALRRRS